MISVDKLTVRFGAFELFKEVTFVVNPQDRVGLVGKNGAGKSTLMKIFAGQQQADEGEVVIPSDIQVGYLPQHMVFAGNKTVIEEATEAFSEVLELQTNIDKLGEQLALRSDYESDEYLKLIHQLTEANEKFDLLGGQSFKGNVERTLIGLGFESTDFTRPASEFSGGWRMRVELAKILLRKPDLLLLDEPTNHLDIESIQWLEDYLKIYPGAVILISHDKAFLDNITNRTVEISLGRIYDYNVPYSKYLIQRVERREQQLAAFRNQQKLIEDTEDFIERFRYKATKAVQVQSRIKQLDRIDRIEVDEEDLSRLNIRFPTPIRSGKIVLEIKDVRKNYGERQILKGVDMYVESGERIAFVGKNGEGKSTLAKIIADNLQHEGLCRLGHNVKIGYFAQDKDEHMDQNKTVFETLDEVAVGDIRTKIRDILGAFMFGGESVDKKVKVLSGGERARLAMAKLLLEPYNLLVLDEPTNHLDIRSKDMLKQALLNYEGTLLVVSHDREFLDGLVTRMFEFTAGQAKEHLCGIYEFLQKKKMNSLRELEVKQTVTIAATVNEPTVGKQNYLEKKEFDRIVRKAEQKVQDCEKTIEKLENELEKLNQILADPDELAKYQQQGKDLFARYNEIKTEIDKQMSNWEEFHNELETVLQQKN
jgi:ATP-binding cassette subfamily F protein 3